MTATVPARRPVNRRATAGAVARPRPRPEAQPQRRPNLRVVDDARLSAAARRRRARLIMVVVAVVTTGCLFALAACNAMLVSGQGRLDRLQVEVREAQSRYSANRLKVAQLESPDRIVHVAQERLGMVPPPGVKYLTPSETVADEVGRPAAPAQTDDGGRPWATVKPYLTPTSR
jgi:cell division protein FtsL